MKPPTTGELRHRLTFRRTIETRGLDGSVAESQVTFASQWARMIPISGNERFAAAGITASVVYDVWVRYFPGLTSQDDFTIDGREFTIEAIRNVDEKNRWLAILATEVF